MYEEGEDNQQQHQRTEQLPLESMGNVNETFRKILGPKIEKRIVGTSIRLRKMSVRIL
jgi:hypothetical protein